MFGQRAADAGAATPALPQPIGEVRLLALRGWRARVVRGLARGAEPGLQLRNPRRQQSDLRSLRFDLSRLRQDQADQIILVKSEERVAIHGYGESSRPLPCQAQSWPPRVGCTSGGGEQLPYMSSLVRTSRYISRFTPSCQTYLKQILRRL